MFKVLQTLRRTNRFPRVVLEAENQATTIGKMLGIRETSTKILTEISKRTLEPRAELTRLGLRVHEKHGSNRRKEITSPSNPPPTHEDHLVLESM